ncbi:hypothetical protein JT05_14590 [Desulfosporosinus sp. Tol-M]|nr:hypothetical protein JT05_14570 [Desulfosporosinus sp. Tol-M]KGP74732.1 hypothetical protein JT05_14590 [Desulfosporosinus sp. Tol-M]
MKDQQKAEEIAGNRVQLILPLLEAGLDPALTREKRKRICEENAISERTLRRYLAEYRVQGFTGLKPKGKGKPESRAISPELMEQAILLRREVPSRSVAQTNFGMGGQGITRRNQTFYFAGKTFRAGLQQPANANV